MQSLDTIHKQKLASYNMAKGQLAVLQRKRTGNLATRDLATVLKKDEVPDIGTSEYLEVVFVAVPKNTQRDFETKYERMSSMVVPRSAKYVAGIFLLTLRISLEVHTDHMVPSSSRLQQDSSG